MHYVCIYHGLVYIYKRWKHWKNVWREKETGKKQQQADYQDFTIYETDIQHIIVISGPASQCYLTSAPVHPCPSILSSFSLQQMSSSSRHRITSKIQASTYATLNNIWTCSNAHANAKKCIFDSQFPGNWFKFGIIENDFWSSRIWAFQIQDSFAGFKNPRIPVMQPMNVLLQFLTGV